MRTAICLGLLLATGRAAVAAEPSPREILDRVLEADPWGLSGAVITARAVVRDRSGATRELAFTGRSRRYDGLLSKGLVRFTAPADVAGVGFLQIQTKAGDDDRYLYLPELKRARRIAGSNRGQSFMGTDFSYADLDRRDLRQAAAEARADETLARFPCWRVAVKPTGADATYARAELWVRKDNFLPLKMEMYGRSGALLKTLTTQEVRRIGGRWFITRSTMVSHEAARQTELVIVELDPRSDLADGEFTVRNLEKQ
ncbi:MAG TPA: outer membrane lipoprotein-sorting protein [Polyangia bacterium]